MQDSKNIFRSNGKANFVDAQAWGLVLIIMLLFFIGYLISSTLQNFGTIYFDLTVIIFLFFGIAWASRRKYLTWVFYGKLTRNGQYLLALAVGLALPLFLNSGVLGFTIGIPLSITSTIAGINSTLDYLVVSFYGPFIEELFWIGLLVPSMMLFFTDKLGNASIGVFLIIGLMLMFIGFTIGIPLSITSTIAGINSTLDYLVVSFYGPFIEELFWIGLLVPSMMLFFTDKLGNASIGVFLIIGLMLMFMSAYIGLGGQALLIGAFMFFTGFIFTIAKISNILNRLSANRYWIVMPIGALFLTILHVYSYGNILNNLPLFTGAFLFFVLEGTVDYYFQSIIPSIMMHTVNNAIVGASALSISAISIPFTDLILPAFIFTIAIMILFLTVLFRVREVFRLKSSGPYPSATMSLIKQEGGVY